MTLRALPPLVLAFWDFYKQTDQGNAITCFVRDQGMPSGVETKGVDGRGVQSLDGNDGEGESFLTNQKRNINTTFFFK